MKSIVGKIGTALLTIWVIGVIILLLVGLSSDGPVNKPVFINVWTFYGFILGIPAVAGAMIGWAGQK
jgi:hypothetical protein